jgi:hypothetical protein
VTVVAFSTPLRPEWRWRIVNYAGEVVEESKQTFPTIGTAVTAGAKRLSAMDTIDRSTRPAFHGRPRPPHLRAG